MIFKNSYFILIMYSVFLTLTVSLSSALAVITKVGERGAIVFQIFAFALMAFYFTRKVMKTGIPLKSFGVSLKNMNYLVFVLLTVIILVQPIMFGINWHMPISIVLLTIIQMVLVGYTEEFLFRGIFFLKLEHKGPLVFVLFSALIFGLLHIVNIVNPDTHFILVLLQVGNAFLLGIVFALLYYFTRSILIVILAHAFFDIFASISNQASITMNMYSGLVLFIIYVLCISILLTLNRKHVIVKK